MINTITLEELDRSIFELIRLEIVAMGYLPDVVQYPNAKDYEAAKQQIIQNKGFIIEVDGVGSGEARGERVMCSISVDRKDITMGSIGGNTVQYRKVNDKFTKERVPQATSNIMYDIRIYTNSLAKERLISEMIYDIIGHRNYYRIAEEYNTFGDKKFFGISKGDISMAKGKQLERLFKFEVEDVWIGRNKVLTNNIVPLTSVVYRFALKDMSGDVEIVEN